MVLTTGKRLTTLVLVLLAALVHAPAAAQYEDVDPPETANPQAKDQGKALADRGFEMFQQGDYAGAIELFKQAESYFHSPMIVSYLAESHERLGRLIEAASYYQKLADEELPRLASRTLREAQTAARTKVPLLRQRVPRVQFEFTGVPVDQIKVKLDERELSAAELAEPIRMNPGKHILRVTAPDRDPQMRSFEARERQLATFSLHFAPVPPKPEAVEKVTVVREEAPSMVHVIGPAAAYGVAGTGLLVGLVSGLIYLDRADALKERCPNNRCNVELEEEKNTVSRLGTITTVGLIVGAVGVTTGTLWWLLAPDTGNGADKAEARTVPEVRLGPGSVQVSGRF